jgi:hypothetical protein
MRMFRARCGYLLEPPSSYHELCHTPLKDAALILQSESPSSVISLKDLTVRQTKERNEYKIIHGETFAEELRVLEASDPELERGRVHSMHGARFVFKAFIASCNENNSRILMWWSLKCSVFLTPSVLPRVQFGSHALALRP